MIYSNLHAQITARMTESSSPVDAPVALSSLSFKLRRLDLEDKRQVTSSYVFCPPNPATSSQKRKSPKNPAAGLAKQRQIYENKSYNLVNIKKIVRCIYSHHNRVVFHRGYPEAALGPPPHSPPVANHRNTEKETRQIHSLACSSAACSNTSTGGSDS